jgi:hypothetical protein
MSRVSKLAATEKHVTGPRGLVRVSGAVTPISGARIMKANAAWLRENDVLGQVVCYSQAAVQITADQLFANALNAAAHAVEFYTPTAFLVREDQRDLFEAYACLMRQGGLNQRAVFTDAFAAQEWAAQQAQVQEYWRRCRQRLAAFPEQPNRGFAARP